MLFLRGRGHFVFAKFKTTEGAIHCSKRCRLLAQRVNNIHISAAFLQGEDGVFVSVAEL